MKLEDIVVGMRVVPHSKTVPGYDRLEYCTEWKKAKEIKQLYLYVVQKSKTILLNHQNNTYSGNYYNPEDFEPYIEGDVNMKKSDLKTGMKLVSRSGDEYIYFDNFEHTFNNTSKILLGKNNLWNNLENYNYDLTNKSYNSHDIVAIYKPSHIYAIGNFFGANNNIKVNNNIKDGYTLIWSEKSEQEIKLENLIEKLQGQLGEAQSELSKIKQK